MKILTVNCFSEEIKTNLEKRNIELKQMKSATKEETQECITLVEYPNYEDFLNWLTNLKTNVKNVVVITEKADDKAIYKAKKSGVIDILKRYNDTEDMCDRLECTLKEVESNVEQTKTRKRIKKI